MPGWLAVTILGIIEGITEFLPISSTGHLLLVENSHLLPQQSDLFNITIQSGAALAVLAAFSARVRDLLAQEAPGTYRIVVGCDGSADRTAERAREAADSRVAVREFAGARSMQISITGSIPRARMGRTA